jgi:NTP pyrophosphatase (non-canonical NTP hydrolase)
MNFEEYQQKALQTDQVPLTGDGVSLRNMVVPLLGLAGEAGELLSEYKKHLRDGASHRLFTTRVAEELGDLLWYVSNVASKFDLNLNNIAEGNLQKIQDRWDRSRPVVRCYDKAYPVNERLPRQLEVFITEVVEGESRTMKAFVGDKQIGNDLTDNAYNPDGYRFHDIFHLSYAAVLGWSPVTRMLLECKRKSNNRVDEVEDGGRAKAIEEGIAAVVFEYAEAHDFLKDVTAIDFDLLKLIKKLTSRLEVAECSLGDWEKAILMGYEVWRAVETNRCGRVLLDLDARTISYLALD